MPKILIQPNTASGELRVEYLRAKGYDNKYNFDDNKLISEVRKESTTNISAYLMSKELIMAVNSAIVTGRPLLIKGEPGSGKTKLAQAVAAHFFGEDAYKYYFEWHVKSKSKASDGGYTFDHVGRLRDATISSVDAKAAVKASNPKEYISLGPMGMAFKAQPPEGKKSILLIDEIDKGDIDFPNDLLLELDEMRFKINELEEFYIDAPKNLRPLVFITSNNERELPPAFLRRCLYYYIPPFDNNLLRDISIDKIKEYYAEFEIKEPKVLKKEETEKFVDAFLSDKQSAKTKTPSTSEMLDWLKLLTYQYHQENIAFEELIKNPDFRNLALKLNA